METPSADDVRLRSLLLGMEFPSPDGDEQLNLLLGDDAPVVSELTGRSIGLDGTPGDDVPAYLVPTAIRAMAMRAERNAVSGTPAAREGAIDSLSLRSFTAGPYSESYFGPGEAAQAKALDLDPEINALLWALATEDKREDWLRIWGVTVWAPAMAVQSVRREPPVPRRGIW